VSSGDRETTTEIAAQVRGWRRTQRNVLGRTKEMVHEHAKRETGTRARHEALTAAKPPRVLLAEYDEEMRALLARTLRRDGYEVTECSDGVALADHLGSFVLADASEDVDLIVSDIRMPGVSGRSGRSSVCCSTVRITSRRSHGSWIRRASDGRISCTHESGTLGAGS